MHIDARFFFNFRISIRKINIVVKEVTIILQKATLIITYCYKFTSNLFIYTISYHSEVTEEQENKPWN